jgi:hypothetical protein
MKYIYKGISYIKKHVSKNKINNKHTLYSLDNRVICAVFSDINILNKYIYNA